MEIQPATNENEYELILRDKDLVDVGEVTRFNAFQCTIKLNEVSSWQLDLTRQDFKSYDIDTHTGIQFWRDGELIFDGPITPLGIKHSLVAGEEKTTVIGGDDLFYLSSRICYPVVTGAIFDTKTANWKFGVMRSPIGVTSKLIKDAPSTEWDIGIVLDNADGFLLDSQLTWTDTSGNIHPTLEGYPGPDDTTIRVIPNSAFAADAKGNKINTMTINGVDLSTNTVTLGVPYGWMSRVFETGSTITQITGTELVHNRSYVGYDTRVGPADMIVKELVHFNAGKGACLDQFGGRAVPELVVATPTGQGATVTANSRGENLLTQVQNICLAGGVNFEIKQVGYELVFDTYIGRDLTENKDLTISIESGNLKEYEWAYGPPTSNMIWGCGPQTGVDKFMLPSADINSIQEFGRFESWIDSSNADAGKADKTQIAANMVASNNLALAQSVKNAQLTLSIQETEQLRFPRNFKLGDKLRVMIGDYVIDQVLTSVNYAIPQSDSITGSTLSGAITKRQTKMMDSLSGMSKAIQQLVNK